MKVKKVETRHRPIQLVEKATQFLEDIDVNVISKMSEAEVQRLVKQINKLEETIKLIKSNI